MIVWTHESLRSARSAALPHDEADGVPDPSPSAILPDAEPRPAHVRHGPGAHGCIARPRIAIVTGNYLNVTDGVSRTLQRLVDHLHARRHRVLVLGPSLHAEQGVARRRPEYVPVPSLPMPSRPEYRLALGPPGSVSRPLDAFSPDVVHVATPDLAGFAALRWAQSRGIPVVATYHTHFPAYLRYYGLNWLRAPIDRYLRWFYSRCRHVYVPTLPLVSYFHHLGVHEPLRQWGRGVDRAAFSPERRSTEWRRRLGLDTEDVLVTFVGRLVREKGLDIFASVVSKLRSRGVRSMIVGDGPLRRTLEARLPGCHFTGHLEGPDLARAYASSDVFLFPSDSEAFGNVIIEAMASGLPVVCAASPSSMHVIHERTGLIAPAGDVEAFLEHTQRLTACTRYRHRMAAKARMRAARYDWERTLDKMLKYYEEVSDSGARSSSRRNPGQDP